MGTETNKTQTGLKIVDLLTVKLNNPLMGTETGFQWYLRMALPFNIWLN